MERQIRRLAAFTLVLFGLLALNVNYIQVIAADDLRNNPANKRLLIQEYRVNRGEILSAGQEQVVARSRETEGELRYQRRYPQADLYAHLTGYYSVVFGRSELEQTYNEYLSGRAAEMFPQRFVDEILGRDKQGAHLILTVRHGLQQIAAEALGSREGAVAAINPQTGEVLALVANPSYNPNELASHDPKEIRAAWDRLNEAEDRPMVSRATDDFFPPGSAFKVVTAAAALEGGMTPDTTFPNPPSLDLPQTDRNLHNFGNAHCAGGASEITLATALEVSCNVTFAQLGLELGAEALIEQSRRFGFSGSRIDFDIPFQQGAIPDAAEFEDNLPGVAQSAIGQRDVRTNVLHMALVAGAIGNDGVMMVPQLVDQIRDPDGRVIRRLRPAEYGRPMSPGNADALTGMMRAVVDEGTGEAAQIPGVAVAGKTGTAQTGDDRDPHAWFIAFAPAERPTVAVAVVVLSGGDVGSEATGGAVAAPIAKAVMEAALTG